MPSLREALKRRESKLRKASGLSTTLRAKDKKKKQKPLEERFPKEYRNYNMDPASDDISFAEYMKKK